MDERAIETRAPEGAEVAPTYRWRRREVMKVRVTWLAMVLVLCLMVFRAITHQWTGLGKTLEVGIFIAVVILPMLGLVLWRFGLLPPERVRDEGPTEGR